MGQSDHELTEITNRFARSCVRLPRGAWVAVLFSVATAYASATAAPVPDAVCRASDIRESVLDRIGFRGELGLADGTRLVLSGLHWPEGWAITNDATEWLKRHVGQPIAYSVHGSSDRWGRMRGDATIGDAEPDDLAVGLVARGMAFVDVGEDDRLCRNDLLAHEADARRQRRGLWAAMPMDAHDEPSLRSQVGKFVVTEGRIVSVRERERRTYLNFSARAVSGLSVTVPKRTWRIMRERGWSAESLRGRDVRVRGVVEMWRGPIIDIISDDMIELREGEQARPR